MLLENHTTLAGSESVQVVIFSIRSIFWNGRDVAGFDAIRLFHQFWGNNSVDTTIRCMGSRYTLYNDEPACLFKGAYMRIIFLLSRMDAVRHVILVIDQFPIQRDRGR